MKNTKKVIKELKLLQAHQQTVIETAKQVEAQSRRIDDKRLTEAITNIREHSELNYSEIQSALEGYHLKLSALQNKS